MKTPIQRLSAKLRRLEDEAAAIQRMSSRGTANSQDIKEAFAACEKVSKRLNELVKKQKARRKARTA